MNDKPNTDVVSRREFLAVLRMLVMRATPEDIALAKERPGHWLNQAKAEIAAGVVRDD